MPIRRVLGRRKRSLAAVFCALAALIVADLAFPPPIAKGQVYSTLVTDRDGRPLRAFGAADGRWRLAADLERIDPEFVKALLAVEDKRFYDHFGVDPIAVLRASRSMIRAGEVVSGASTITMQTARLLEPRPRTVSSKLVEMIRAVQIERRLSKSEILELYLTLAPYGGNLEGIRSACWAYFGREPDRLSADQIALLIALPQSPEVRRPDIRPKLAHKGREAVVTRLTSLGYLTEQQAGEAIAAPLPKRQNFPAHAWHAAERIKAANPNAADIASTIDAGLQSAVEELSHDQLGRLEADVQMSILVVDVETRGILAMVGAADRHRKGGWLDLTNRPRSPGSTLKPFIYGLAFDDGIAAPDTHIQDLPTRFASYRPENFDRTFKGDVRVRDALQHSLNVPAVLALDRVGPQRFATLLSFAGVNPRITGQATKEAGLALALGGIGLTTEELAVLYAGLADDGRVKPLVWTKGELTGDQPSKRLLSPESATEIVSILKNSPAPPGRMPTRLTADAPEIAYKTGTSYGFRDAWAAGIARGLAVVVWVGRADGAPRPGQTGRDAALPILFDVMDLADRRLDRAGDAAHRLSGKGKIARDAVGRDRFEQADAPPQILFPPDNAELWAKQSDDTLRTFVFAGRSSTGLTWYVDGELTQTDATGAAVWTPDTPGFYRVDAVDEAGRASTVQIRVLAPTG